MKRPNTLTFNYKAWDKKMEECPSCHIVTWLGVGEDGTKMCQNCYFKPESDDELEENR